MGRRVAWIHCWVAGSEGTRHICTLYFPISVLTCVTWGAASILGNEVRNGRSERLLGLRVNFFTFRDFFQNVFFGS